MNLYRFLSSIDKIPLNELIEMDKKFQKKFNDGSMTERESDEWTQIRHAIKNIKASGIFSAF